MSRCTIPFAELGRHDVATVGGKNSSLGEMIAKLAALDVSVPGGFATTADAYRAFLAHEGLAGRIKAELDALDVDDVARLAETGARIRQWILSTPFPPALETEIVAGYVAMCEGRGDVSVAVRSSATAEDLPEASFAGQQETLLQRPRQCERGERRARGLCVAVQRPRDRLSRAPGLRTLAGRAFRRHPAHGAERPRRERRHVHARHRLRLP